jgi:hypothetical protein
MLGRLDRPRANNHGCIRSVLKTYNRPFSEMGARRAGGFTAEPASLKLRRPRAQRARRGFRGLGVKAVVMKGGPKL